MTQTAVQRRYVRLSASMNKKAAKLDRPGRVTPEDLAILYIESKGSCAYCGDGINPDTTETDLHQPGTEPLMDPATVKAVASESEMLRRAADTDKG